MDYTLLESVGSVLFENGKVGPVMADGKVLPEEATTGMMEVDEEWVYSLSDDDLVLFEARKKEILSNMNHLVLNHDKGKWGRGFDVIEAMRNCNATLESKMTYFIFKDDSWDIFDTGAVKYNRENLIHTSNLNF